MVPGYIQACPFLTARRGKGFRDAFTRRRRQHARRHPKGVTNDVLTMEGLRRRRAEILGVAHKRRAHRIAVFGSVARGEADSDSDLDLLVDFEPGASLLDHIGLFQDREDLLGVDRQ